MEINAIFVTGIGVVSEPNSLKLAQKIFAENKNTLMPSTKSKHFNTSLNQYYLGKANIRKFSNEDDVNQLKQIIKTNAFKYLEMIGYDVHKIDLEVINFWLNEMQNESFHVSHNHYGFNLSGTYYVEVPQNSGSILFTNPSNVNTCASLPVKEYTPLNSEIWTLNPKEGDMFFWKSDLMHSVPLIKFDGIRRSIAFDILITLKN
jgi:uncharacterized protein (TIGR02466 family)